VGREEDRGAGRASLGDHLQELVLHQRIESARRLVEDQQVGSRHEGQEEGDLSSIARGQVPGRPVEVDLEARRDRFHGCRIDPAAEPCDRADELPRRHPLRQAQLARDVADPSPHVDAVASGIPSQDLDGPLGRPDQIEQAPDGGALAGAVGAYEAEDLTDVDIEVDAAHRLHVPVTLDQSGRPDGGGEVR
jgi:hypothetical protein